MGIGRGLAAVIVCAAAALSSQAQAETSRPVRIIVPSTPGGGADVLARMLADQIGRTQGQTVVVENRPGAGNTIGTEAVARAAPDGNTLVITTPEFVINSHLRKLSYDPLTSFAPICVLANSPQLIMVNPATPYRTLGELLNAARQKPGELTIASAGPASSPHVGIERIKHDAKVNLTFVPYQGSGPALNALLGQHVTAAVASYPNVAGQMKSGQLRPIATASRSRIPDLPDTRTVAEDGFRDFDFDIWFGLVAPAGTPPEIVQKIYQDTRKVLESTEMKARFYAQGLAPVGNSPADFAKAMKAESQLWAKVVKERKIQVK